MISSNFIILFCVASVRSALPEGWKTCEQSSADYEECLKNQINNAIVYFKNGSKKMGIIPLDPLKFDSMVVEQGSGPVSITMKMYNVSILGLSDTKATSVKNNWKKMLIQFHVPHSRTVGNYTGQGQVLFLPIYGTGEFSLDWENLNYTFDITFKQITKNGKKYFQVDKMALAMSPQKIVIYLGSLFNGNKEFGDNMNKFLNENWQEIFEEMKPAISQTLETAYSEYINRILSKITAEEIDAE